MKERLRRLLSALSLRRRELFVDVVGIGGLAFVAVGAREVYRPAGWLVVGTGMLSFAVWASVKGRG